MNLEHKKEIQTLERLISERVKKESNHLLLKRKLSVNEYKYIDSMGYTVDHMYTSKTVTTIIRWKGKEKCPQMFAA